MFDQRISEDWPKAVVEATARLRQGDVIPWPAESAYVANGPDALYGESDPDDSGQFLAALDPSPEWAVITSQTCDIDEQGTPRRKPWFQYAPIFRADDGGRRGLFTWPLDGPDLPEGEWYADLRFEGIAEKTLLAGLRSVRGFSSEEEADAFGRHLGHLRSRPAFANHLVETVTEHLRQQRKQSSDGIKKRLKREVTEVRLQMADGSRLEPHAVRVVVLHRAEPTKEATDWFAKWYDAARPQAAEAGIELHAVRHLDASHLDYHEIKDLTVLDFLS